MNAHAKRGLEKLLKLYPESYSKKVVMVMVLGSGPQRNPIDGYYRIQRLRFRFKSCHCEFHNEEEIVKIQN